MYKPLHPTLTIKQSSIHGLGIFSTQKIKKDTCLGVTHIAHPAFPQGWIRTPLGGLYNHSDDPNCILKNHFIGRELTAAKLLITIKDIHEGKELTCIYTLYSIFLFSIFYIPF